MKMATVPGVVGSLFVATSQGAVLFQQAPYTAETTGLISAVGGQIGADDFTPTSSVQVNGVNWYGFFYQTAPTQPHQFQISFHAGIGGAVSDPAIAQYTVTPTTAFAFSTATDMPTVNSFSAVIPPVTLSANQRVWISIVDLEGNASSQFRWQESSLGRLSADWGTKAPGGIWLVSNGGNLAFSLEGVVVPEPNAAVLLAVGSGALLVWRRFSGVSRRR